jgi:alpha-acetolactate decarboxylase
VPDFGKLGFQIMSVTFTKLKEHISEDDIEKRRKVIHEKQNENPDAYILGMGGMGLGADRVIITYHEDYSSYAKFIEKIKSNPLIKVEEVKSFLVNLATGSHYSGLTLSEVANYLVRNKEKE